MSLNCNGALARLAPVFVVLAMAWSGAAAQEMVQVGKELKRATATVVSLESGDVACYLSLKDDKGASFRELADFAVCEQKPSIKGKRVALKYTQAKVMADECGGDMNCKKTRTVTLVSAARVLDAAPAQPPAAQSAGGKPAAAAGGQTSWCTPMETVVFACQTGAKLVSVCAAKNAPRNGGYLQYRFGRPSEPLELTLPEGNVPAARAASGETVPFAGGGGSWLRFGKGDFGYVVYSGIGRWGPKGQTMEKQGLVVERGRKTIASLKCTSPLISELGPDWFQATGVTTNGREFDFPE